MKPQLIAAAIAFLALAPGMSSAQVVGEENKPLNPGSIRVTTRAPEADKWIAQRNANGSQRIFRCKPLACPDPQAVSFVFLKSPTLHPDPKALEKFAKEDLPKSIRAAGAAREVLSDGTDKIETLASATATLKGYPSVVNESKFSRGKRETYMQTAIIFAGPVMIRIQSSSADRELAQKTMDQFVDVMRIEEGPPGPPPAQTKPPQSLQGT